MRRRRCRSRRAASRRAATRSPASEPPTWYKAPPLALKPRATVDEALQAILRACLHHWCINEAAALDGRDPEGVHQMRVALRRLRSAVSVFGRLIAPERRHWLAAGARRVIGALGPARDWDVFLDRIAGAGAGRAARPIRACTRCARPPRASAERGYEAARAAIGAPDYTRFLLELGRWIEAARLARAADRAGRGVVRPADRRRSPITAWPSATRRPLRLGRGFAELTPAERHRLRIALKKLRYTAEFFQGLYGKKRTRAYLGGAQAAAGRARPSERRRGGRDPHRRLLGRAGDAGRARAGRRHGAGLARARHGRGRSRRRRPPGSASSTRKPFWH